MRISIIAASSIVSMAGAQGAEPIKALPGVEAPPPIVTPAEPEKEPSASDADGWLRAGDWDLKVSGSVRVDIGIGAGAAGNSHR